MSHVVPITGFETSRKTALAAGLIGQGELIWTTQRRLFAGADLIGPKWLGEVASEAAMLALNATKATGCWPLDVCTRSDTSTLWVCLENHGEATGDWRELGGGGGDGGSGGISDGDKGDIIVSDDGSTWTIDPALISELMREMTALDDKADIRDFLELGTAAALDVDTDDTLAAASDTRLPTQKAVKSYIDAAVDTIEVPDYSLPIATPSVLGGVKVGSGLQVDAFGVLSLSAALGVLIFIPFFGIDALTTYDDGDTVLDEGISWATQAETIEANPYFGFDNIGAYADGETELDGGLHWVGDSVTIQVYPVFGYDDVSLYSDGTNVLNGGLIAGWASDSTTIYV